MKIGNNAINDVRPAAVGEVRIGPQLVWTRVVALPTGELVISVDGFLVKEVDGFLMR